MPEQAGQLWVLLPACHLESPCRALLLSSSSHSSWSRQVAADDRIFTRGNHDGISVYPLQQVDKSQQMGFPSELDLLAYFCPGTKMYPAHGASARHILCLRQPTARNCCPQHKPGGRMALGAGSSVQGALGSCAEASPLPGSQR